MQRPKRALVLVQGDAGRSPRMLYHAHALAAHGVRVDLVGFEGTGLPSAVGRHEAIAVHRVPDPAPAGRGRAIVLRAGVRAARQAVRLARALAPLPAPDLVLVQMPPSIPSGPLAWWLARTRGCRVVFDWHNLGWTIFAAKAGPAAVSLLRRMEHSIGRSADAHLCVSAAMRGYLATTLGVDARVVYDRAPEWFEAPDDSCRRAVRARLFANAGFDGRDAPVLISPTSFAPDDDADVLIEAANLLDARRAELHGAARVLLVASGKGQGRDAFERRAAARPRDAVATVRADWVDPDAYPALLAAADAGICTHRSSSGLDLPMKLADMYGVGLPVIARDSPAIRERVRDEDNGVLFRDAFQLSSILTALLGDDPGRERLSRLRAASLATGRERWLSAWTRDAAPVLHL